MKSITPGIINGLFNSLPKNQIIEYFGFGENDFQHYKTMHEKGMETFRLSMFYFLLIEKSTLRPIGECGFHTWNRTHNRAELFYHLRNDVDKDKKYMSEALIPVLEHGFTVLNLHRIEALVADWNMPSVKLLLKNGFTKEGTMREDYFYDGHNQDSDCYSLLKWEWEMR